MSIGQEDSAFGAFSPLALDQYGTRVNRSRRIHELLPFEDPLEEVEYLGGTVVCTDCERFIYKGVEYVIQGRPLGYCVLNRVILFPVLAVNCVTGAEHSFCVVPPVKRLVGWSNPSFGVYEPGGLGTVITRPSVNKVELPDEKTLYLETMCRTSFWAKPIFLLRRAFNNSSVREMFRPPPGYGYVDEQSYASLEANKLQFLKDPDSDVMRRMINSFVVKKRVKDEILTISDSTVRATGYVFSVLAGTQPVGATSIHGDFADMRPELIPRRNVGHGCIDLWISVSEVTFSQPPGLPPFTRDNGNVIPGESETGEISYSAEDGLRFKHPFSRSVVVRCIGPAHVSPTVIYDCVSTESASNAFTRLTNSREGEVRYRHSQDFMFYIVARSPLFHGIANGYNRNLADMLRWMTHWGLAFNQLPRYIQRSTLLQKLRAQQLVKYYELYVPHVQAGLDSQPQYQRLKLLHRHENRVAYAELPHPKKALRMSAVLAIEKDPRKFYSEVERPVNAKVKDEIAKSKPNGQVKARQFIGLGDEAVVDNPWLPVVIKKAMESPFFYRFDPKLYDGLERGIVLNDFEAVRANADDLCLNEIHFLASPELDRLDFIFSTLGRMHSSVETVGIFRNVAYDHGDDHSNHCVFDVQYDTPGGPVVERSMVSLDCDFAAFDLSHGPGLWYTFHNMCTLWGLDCTSLLMQMMRSIMIEHPNKDIKEVLILKMRTILMFTGSTLTTVGNTNATYPVSFLYSAEFRRLKSRPFVTLREIEAAVLETAAIMGYEVTVTITATKLGSRPEFPKYKLLMYFPVRVEGSDDWVGIPCLGRLFRKLGWTTQKFTNPEFEYKNIVRGFLSSHTSPLHNLISMLVLGKPHEEVELIDSDQLDSDHLNYGRISARKIVRLDDIAHRYSYNVEQMLAEVEFFFRSLRPRIIESPFIARVLNVDYGVLE